MMQRRWKRGLMGLSIGIGAGLVVWLLAHLWPLSGFLTRFEAATYDWRMVLATDLPEKPIEEIVIVDIDERSIQKLGKFHQWPRTYWARAIDYVCGGKPRLVGLDILFDRDLRHPTEDLEFVNAVDRCGHVAGAILLSLADSSRFRYPMAAEPVGFPAQRFQVHLPEKLLYKLPAYDRLEAEFIAYLEACQRVGFVNMPADPDGVFRRLPLFARFNEHAYPAFSVAMALKLLNVESVFYDDGQRRLRLRTANGDEIRVPVDDQGRMLIRYQGPYGTFRYISFYDVLMKFVPQEYFADRVVLFGSSATALFDLKPTPVQPVFPGVEINASVLYQLLHRQFLLRWDSFQALLYLLAVCALAGLCFIFLRPLAGSVVGLLFILALVLCSLFMLVNHSAWIPLVQPLLGVLFAFAGAYMYRYLHEERDKRQLRQVFSRYVAPAVVDEILKDPAKLKLGGERRVCTVLFSDLEGFTSLSEKTEPEDLVRILNAYLSEMTEVILQAGGTLDKYEGDAIMAIFGAPIDQADHALRACRAAVRMQKRLDRLSREKGNQGFPALKQRIGINSGEMIVGNMGSSTRFDYTAIGDAVNLAARLESANKVYGTRIIISEHTYQLVEEAVVARLLDLVRVRGRQEPVKIYELIDLKSGPLDDALREKLAFFQQGIQYYLERKWDWAMNQFRQVLQIDPNDAPARLYVLRCQELLENPPGPTWDGVFAIRAK
ncbi:MAG: adenylate/guanylate cyclase domain-containing protein [Calditrichaeota bacterium]|nr:MAG: adenylate/guanylate cyclase domain-containing protein [Calditrichota bacterium]